MREHNDMTTNWMITLTGKKLRNACSTLSEFSCETDSEHDLILQAINSDSGPKIEAHLVPKNSSSRESDAVCKVDWSWINDSTILQISFTGSAVRLQLAPAGPLTISAQLWQGKPFLAFQPYKAP